MSTCRGCGKEIVWGTTEDGKKIPLDPKAVVFMLGPRKLGEDDRYIDGDLIVKPTKLCPKASQFSASNRKEITP